MLAIETIDLQKQFGSHKALHSLNLQIPAGTICGFLGRNGAGKTTTLKMLAGLSRPSSGKIIIHGKERTFSKIDNSNIGYLPDVPNFYNYFSAREYLDFSGKLYGMAKNKRRPRIEEMLIKVGLQDHKTPIAEYSRGMKQRLGIAGALMNSPEIILLDEPISALAPIGRREVMDLIRSLHGSVTVFFSTHILSDIEKTCDYAVILDHGNLLMSDTIDNIKLTYTGNSALLRLGSASDCKHFLDVICNDPEIEIKKSRLKELRIYTEKLSTFQQKLPEMLFLSNAALEHYEIHIPTLEDIFLEVTSNE